MEYVAMVFDYGFCNGSARDLYRNLKQGIQTVVQSHEFFFYFFFTMFNSTFVITDVSREYIHQQRCHRYITEMEN